VYSGTTGAASGGVTGGRVASGDVTGGRVAGGDVTAGGVASGDVTGGGERPCLNRGVQRHDRGGQLDHVRQHLNWEVAQCGGAGERLVDAAFRCHSRRLLGPRRYRSPSE